ncbi:MAG: hypothetical protein IJZ85_12325 [Lachnospiraceae bacterium]|nr:hypothetical protein [Lachnospiraceae bacterium]
MTELLNEYFGSISTGQITMGQMLLLAGAALLVFSVLLTLIFAIFKVKYKPDKAKDAAVQTAPPRAAKQTGRSVQSAQQPGQKGTDVLPKANQPEQKGTVVLPKADQSAQNGTVVLPKANQPEQNGTVVLPKREQPARTENGTVILPKQGADAGDQIYGKEFGDTVDMQRYRQDQEY